MDWERKNTETMVPKDYKPEAEEVAKFMEELDQSGKEKFLEFIRGAKFALALTGQKSAT